MWKPLVTLNWILFTAVALGLSVVTGTVIYRSAQIPDEYLAGTIRSESDFVALREQPDESAPIGGFLRTNAAVRIEKQAAFTAGEWVFIEISASHRGWVKRELVELTER